MKKWNMMMLVLAMLALPATGMAQDLPDFLSAVYTGMSEGLEQGAMQAMAAMDQELTLEMIPESERIEEGQTICLTVRAGNPRPQPAEVGIVLDLPERLTALPDVAWTATLPAAQMDSQTGALVPSQTLFTREITLVPGGESVQADITAEMSMGTRFYRAQAALALCVPDVRVSASIEGDRAGRLYPGDAFSYRIEVVNSGTAPKDVALEMILPEGVELMQALPTGFVVKNQTIQGTVRAEAAPADVEEAPAAGMVIELPVCVKENALEGDADASRLMTGVLRADGERVPLPRVQVCGAKISAKLTADSEELKAGEEAKLRVVVVNAGLAPAAVQVSCVLPDGLTLADAGDGDQEEESQEKEATAGELIATVGSK